MLAYTVEADSIAADPARITDPAATAAALCRALENCTDKERVELVKKLTGTNRFVYVRRSRQVSPDQARKVAALDLEGVVLSSDTRRYYPRVELAAHVLGFVGIDNKGQAGLERTYDTVVRGKEGRALALVDARRNRLDMRVERPPEPGATLELTLDMRMQYIAERELRNGVEQNHAAGGALIVMDPNTGEVLALASYPTFNPNIGGKATDAERRNRATQDVYEPGSTFKIVTVAAALEDNVVAPDSTFLLAPTIKVSDRTIREAHTRGTERMSVRQILSESSNVGTITIAQQLGGPQLASWIDRFGFGSTTGSELPGESPGMVLPYDRWSGSTIGTVPIGQGIAVTPLQMVSAYAAIGNDGVMAPAHVIAKVAGKKVRHGAGRRVVSQHTADRMTAMFRDVVVEGTGTEAAIPGYTVAGKTGTANKVENGVYVSKYVASFVGLVPARKPRLAILVMVDEPRGQIWGGVVAAPLFRDIARFALQYLEVPPDAPESKSSTALLAAASSTP
jgi:cell division protein FtsI/penicillin-binding protein 2